MKELKQILEGILDIDNNIEEVDSFAVHYMSKFSNMDTKYSSNPGHDCFGFKLNVGDYVVCATTESAFRSTKFEGFSLAKITKITPKKVTVLINGDNDNRPVSLDLYKVLSLKGLKEISKTLGV